MHPCQDVGVSAEICDFSDNARYFLELLGRLLRKDLDQLNLSETFTRMGGDSVLAIRLSAKLRDQGIQLSSASLLGKLPIEALAKELLQQEIQQERLESTPLEGEVPLAPMQRRFWDLKLLHPHHYNQSVMLVPNFPGDVILDSHILKKCLVSLAEHHDMLRASCLYAGERCLDLSQETHWVVVCRSPLMVEMWIWSNHAY